jgi:hypothetical protein
MQRLFTAAGIGIMALALASCGAINFAYNNAPAFVSSEFEDVFDLDDAQVERLDIALQNFFAWHRQHELPRYQQLLEQAEQAVADGITETELLQLNADFRIAWQRSLARMIDDLSGLATTLTPQQIENYAEYFYDESAKYRDYLEMSAQQREIFQVERGLKRLQEWFGDFDEFESDRVTRKLQQLPELRSDWIAYREARQQDLLRALRAGSDEDLLRQQLKFILLDPASAPARTIEPKRRIYWQAYAQAIAEISQDLGKTHRNHAVERLQYYAEIVASLQQAD